VKRLGESGAIALQNNMSNQTAAAVAAIVNSINWERKGLNLQSIIQAANQGKLGQPLTDWLVSQGWVTVKFIAKEKFVINIGPDALVKISYLGDNFKKWFLNGEGKVEDMNSTNLVSLVLETAVMNKEIIAKIGDEVKAETSLTEIYDLITKQPNGEKGVLLNSGWANIFYVRDQNGVLRMVHVFWSGDGWFVSAGSVDYPHRWRAGSRVFSRRNVLRSSETSVPASV